MPNNSWVVKYSPLGGNFCGVSVNGTELMPISVSFEKSLNCLTIMKLQIYICDGELKFVEVNPKEEL